jgi:D-3-phosphoglycerate dehydrogenase
MCDERFFAAMKPGALLINTSRGAAVNEAALASAVKAKGIRAALDVYAEQPAEKQAAWKPAIADLAGVTCSHHNGASTEQAQTAVAEEVVRIVQIFKDEGRVEHCVNPA